MATSIMPTPNRGRPTAGVTAIIDNGAAPGLTNLFAIHAAAQLDVVETVEVAWTAAAEAFLADPGALLADIRGGGRVNAGLQTMMQYASETVRTFDDGAWRDVPGLERTWDVPLLSGGSATVYEVGSPEPVTLPRFLPSLRRAHTYMGLIPAAVMAVVREQGRRVTAGSATPREAVISLLEAVAGDPDRYLATPMGAMAMGFIAVAEGERDGQRTRSVCTPTSFWISTHGPLAVVAKAILTGDVSEVGVLAPEQCFEPVTFFAAAAQFGPEPPAEGRAVDVVVTSSADTMN